MDSAWLAPVLPAAAFLINVLIWRNFAGRYKHALSALTSIAAIVGAFVVFLITYGDAMTGLAEHGGAAAEALGPQHFVAGTEDPWFAVGPYAFHATLVVDWLSIMMLGVVSFLASFIQIYAVGYMKGDNRFWWFFSVMSLFCAAMLGLVLSANLLLLYMCWEGVGLCSFLLIGFWYQERDNAEAAKKAFITTRVGDVGFFIGLALLFLKARTFQMDEIFSQISSGQISGAWVTAAGILIFMGAMGKSGQFPLHVWLPDAMAGPTPVSALVHSATMVAAGVYLVGRAYPIFAASPITMGVIATVGTITLIFAATIALTQRDIKRILAYSTVSQLGYMMMALGVGAYTAGLFHLYTHSFFKALLFLGAGSVIHGLESVYGHHDKRANDIFNMGGLRKRMPITFWTFLIASLSLAGIFPLSGFWSKDAILGGAVEAGAWIPFLLALITAFLTAFYMFRGIFLAFFGEEHWRVALETGSPAAGTETHAISEEHHPAVVNAPGAGHSDTAQHGDAHGAHVPMPPHESPWLMTLPLLAILVPAAIAGWLGIPDVFNPFSEAIHFGEHAEEHINLVLAIAGTIAGLLGIFLAWAIYLKKAISAEAISAAVPGAYRTLYNKYYFDEAYQWVINRLVLGLSGLMATFDRKVINETVVDRPAYLTAAAGSRIRFLETGRVYNYAFAFIVGVVIVAAIIAFPYSWHVNLW